MGDVENPLIKLHGLSTFSESMGGLDDNLQQLAKTAAHILNAENSSIMLIKEGDEGAVQLTVRANFGDLPNQAYQESIKAGEGISGSVFTEGKSLLIEDIQKSSFSSIAKRSKDPRKSMISSPILVNGQIIGVININGPKFKRPFNLDDLNLLDIVALFVGKSIQVIQLQSVLNSRFAQIALAQETDKTIGHVLISAAQNPDQMAKIVAKSFYREMAKAGFGPNQIISAASEIISQLSSNLNKHTKRLKKD